MDEETFNRGMKTAYLIPEPCKQEILEMIEWLGTQAREDMERGASKEEVIIWGIIQAVLEWVIGDEEKLQAREKRADIMRLGRLFGEVKDE